MIKISVITAVYNNRETIVAALESALAQTDVDLELVVIDGGSTDGTLDLLRSYSHQLDVLVSEPDGGIYDALNKGIRCATGEVVGFLHSDDLFADTSVLSQIASAFADPAVGAVYGDLVYVRRDSPDRVVRYWRAGEFSWHNLSKGWMPPHPTLYVRRSIYERVGMFDISYRIAADYDFILRLLVREKPNVQYIPQVLVKMRVGGASNCTLWNILHKSREDLRVLRCNRVGGIGAFLWKNASKLPQFLVRWDKRPEG